MNRALRLVATFFGVFAGIGGIEHGYFEILRGDVAPNGVMIASMGPPCVPEAVWHACEPAMTILPSFLWTGIISLILGVITIVWSAGFVQRRRGGAVLTLLSVALLLFGGGIFPPLIGIIGGLVGTRLYTPLKPRDGVVGRWLAGTWPWLLVALFVWLFGQVVIGRFFNDFLLQTGWAIPVLILGLLVLSVLSAFAHDAQNRRP